VNDVEIQVRQKAAAVEQGLVGALLDNLSFRQQNVRQHAACIPDVLSQCQTELKFFIR
jgi:hypothetical protein